MAAAVESLIVASASARNAAEHGYRASYSRGVRVNINYTAGDSVQAGSRMQEVCGMEGG